MNGNGRGTLAGAFRFAWRGVLDAALSQRNMRLHLVAAVLVAAFASAVPLGVAEQLALLASVFLVLAAEVMNTAIEAAVDLAARERGERARVAKDAAAGAVLVLAAGAATVFAVVLVHNWELVMSAWREVGRVVALGASLAALSAFLVFPFPRPGRLDLLAALGGAVLLLPLALLSKGLVFTAVAALAFAVCASAAFARRQRQGGPVADPLLDRKPLVARER
jgi:diacylglycerol kinase